MEKERIEMIFLICLKCGKKVFNEDGNIYYMCEDNMCSECKKCYIEEMRKI